MEIKILLLLRFLFSTVNCLDTSDEINLDNNDTVDFMLDRYSEFEFEGVDNYVIGGSPAKAGKYPFMCNLFASERFPYAPHCGGTLIAPNMVLTAAHCVASIPTDFIQVGHSDLSNQKEDSEVFRVKEIFIHPGYNMQYNNHDIAIVKLNSKSTKSIANLPNMSPKKNDKAKVIGFGKTTEGRWPFPTPLLMEVDMKVMNADECKSTWFDFLRKVIKTNIGLQFALQGFTETFKTTACTNPQQESPSFGDSGGPLLSAGGNIVFGVVSFGGHFTQLPKVYSDVFKHKKWIDSILSKKDDYVQLKSLYVHEYSLHSGQGPKSFFLKSMIIGGVLIISLSVAMNYNLKSKKRIEIKNVIVEPAIEEVEEMQEELEVSQIKNLKLKSKLI